MKKEEFSRFLQSFLAARKEGKEPYCDADEIDKWLDYLEEKEDFTHYEEILSWGLRLHPMSNELKIRQCKLLLYNEEYEKALTLVDSIAETNDQDLDMIRLECLCTLDRYPKALEYIEYLTRENCEYLEDLFEFIVPVLSDLEMYTESSDLINRGLLMFPGNPVLKDELCYIYELNGNFEEAIRLCNELIDDDPYSYDYWFTLGRLYSLTGLYEKAIDAFDFALTCDDADMELLVLKAYCLYMNENYEKAIEIYAEMAADGDEETYERVHPLMAECYIKLDQFEKAYQLLKGVVMKKDIETEASNYVNFIRCCVETDRGREATSMLLKAADLFPDNVRILSLLALSYLENGKEDLALSVTNKMFNQLDIIDSEQTIDCLKLLEEGQRFYLNGDIEMALKNYKKILQINPRMPLMHFHIAMAYFSLGDMESFDKHLRKTTKKEMAEYLKSNKGFFNLRIFNRQEKYIPPEELSKEYLKNKGNNN